MKIKNLTIAIFFIITHLCSGIIYAEEDGSSLIAKSKYFSVYGHRGLDIQTFLGKLDMNYFLQPDSVLDNAGPGEKDILAKTLDSIFLEVSDVLDIHIYSFEGNIEVLPDKASVNDVYRKYFNADFQERSFYLTNTNTIYISLDDVTLGMIGHEMSHAIISRYFVVPPPSKIQEVLCGYVEFRLRKLTNTLD
ncbi:MAG: hypothetical protein ABH848_01275 [Candidatus Omnitrophota bacterium]